MHFSIFVWPSSDCKYGFLGEKRAEIPSGRLGFRNTVGEVETK